MFRNGHYASIVRSRAQLLGYWRFGDAASYDAEVLRNGAPVGYWRLTEATGTTAADASGRGHDGTYIGGPALGAPGPFENGERAVRFDGSNDYVTVTHDDFRLNSAFSAEIWVQTTRSGVELLRTLTQNGTGGWGLWLNEGRPRFLCYRADNSAIFDFSAPVGITVLDGRWHYICATYDLTTAIIYLDGQPVATSSASATPNGTANTLTINQSGGNSLAGILARAACYARALSATEIATRYAARRCRNTSGVSYASQVLCGTPVGFWRLTEQIGPSLADSSGHGYTATAQGTLTFGRPGPLANGETAISFSSGYATAGDTAALHFTSAFTIAAWVNVTRSTWPDGGTNLTIFDDETFQAKGLIVRIDGGTKKLYVRTNQAGTYTDRYSTGTIEKNRWYHIAVTFDGTHARFYLDGQLDGSAQSLTSAVSGSGTVVTLGATVASGQNFDGDLAGFEAIGRALTAAEIAARYAARLSTSQAGTASIADTSPGNHDGTAFHGITLGEVSRFRDGDSACDVNGTTGTAAPVRIQIAHDTAFDAMASALSIECWLKVTDTGTSQKVIAKASDTTETFAIWIESSGGQGYPVFHAQRSGAQRTAGGAGSGVAAVTDGSWHYLVVTFNQASSAVTFYVDGAQSGGTFTLAGSGTLTTNADDIYIGAEPTGQYKLNGSIDEVAIYSRVLAATEIAAAYDEWTARPAYPDDVRIEAALGGDYRSEVLADDPAGFWMLDDVIGTSADDLTENANNLTYQGSPTLGVYGFDPCCGGAPHFDGSTQYANLPGGVPGALEIGGAITLECWLKTTTTTHVQSGLVGYTVAANAQLTISGSTVTFWLRKGGGANEISYDNVTLYDGRWHHLVATWDGTTNTNGLKLYLDGVLRTQGTSGTAATGTFPSWQIGREASSNYFEGQLAGVAIYSAVLSATRIGAHYDAAQWTDLSPDVHHRDPIEAEYGIRASGPTDRIATTGVMQWSMKNSIRSSGGVLGYYTPGHPNARPGWEIGIPVRLAIDYAVAGQAATVYKWRGTLVAVEPAAGEYGKRVVRCQAFDWMDEAAQSLIKVTTIQQAVRSDNLIRRVIEDSVTRVPPHIDFEVGQSTFAFALDNVLDDETVALRAISDTVFAEVGFCYPIGDTVQGGTLRFEDRHYRSLADVVAIFDEEMVALEASRARDAVYNRVTAIVRPREVDTAATTVLWELTPTETVPQILPGETVTFTGLFRSASGRYARVGGTDLVTPVATTDYLGNTQPDGSGTDRTSSLVLTFAATTNAATFAFRNTHASDTIYLTKVQVRGKAISDRYELAVTAENASSQRAIGGRDLSYDMIFDDRASVARDVANMFVSLYGTLATIVPGLDIQANSTTGQLAQVLIREPGDRIRIVEPMTNLDADYFINGVRLSIRAGNLIGCSWALAPAFQQEFWVLEDPELGLLGQTTVLGFG